MSGFPTIFVVWKLSTQTGSMTRGTYETMLKITKMKKIIVLNLIIVTTYLLMGTMTTLVYMQGNIVTEVQGVQ